MLSRNLFSLLLIGLFFLALPAQNLNFLHYGIEEGLSDLNVGPIIQDQKGFIWVGSTNGVHRFDGKEFVSYMNIPGDSSSLLGNSISDIFEDKNGNIWVATRGGGVNLFQWETDNFSRILHEASDQHSLGNNYVNAVLQTADGRIWIGTDKGLNYTEDLEPPFQFHHFSVDSQSTKVLGFSALLEYPKGILWAGSARDGLFRIDLKRNKVEQWVNKEGQPNYLAGNRVKKIHLDHFRDGTNLWVASSGGLTKLALNGEQPQDFKIFRYNSRNPSSIPGNQVFSVTGNHKGEIWVGTYSRGIAEVIQHEDSIYFIRHKHEEADPSSLASDYVYEVYLDDSGILWVGTERGGLNQAFPRYRAETRKYFRHLLRKPLRLGETPVQSITSLLEDNDENLWIGTESGGLDCLSPQDELLFRMNSGKDKLSNGTVTALHQDKQGIYWVGTFGGFNRMEFDGEISNENARITQYLHDPSDSLSLKDNHIFALYEDINENIWIGTRGGGLNRFDKSTESFTAFTHDVNDPYSINNNYVWYIFPEADSGLWLATDGGLNYLNLKTNRFYHLSNNPLDGNSLTNDYVNSVIKDSKGNLWVGTAGGGINLLHNPIFGDTLSGSFLAYQQKDGLLDDIVYELREDKHGDLWISSNFGLTRMDLDQLSEKGEISSSAFQHFDKSDGLQDNEFNMGAALKMKSGKLIFGGLNGLSLFNPDSIPLNYRIPEVYFTRFEILNQEIRPGDLRPNGNIPLKSSLPIAKDIYLSHRDYMITFHFAALNYIFPEDNLYAYKMEGLDDDWIYSGNANKATYTNLNPGTYTFYVKGSNNDGLWNESGTSVILHVSPAPWLSWWAYLLYSILILATIGLFVRYRVKAKEKELLYQARLERIKQEEREQIRKETSADFHDELGNKMTKISLFAEMANRSLDQNSQVKTYLNQLMENTQSLSEGIRDFIWMLDPEQDTLYNTLIRLKEFGQQLFEHTGIQFRVSELSEQDLDQELSIVFRRHLLLIIKEAFHNALKYSEAKNVSLQVSNTEHLQIQVVDDGKGFLLDQEEQNQGYGLKNMRKRAEILNIDLQVITNPGEGTCLNLSIPKIMQES